ncbi:MAG TPA: Yip1 family protein [Roseiarcus sp.]|nr:Yip1 family protein [Roseiarcus sp.]
MDLVERVKAIILSPQTEWPKIESEPGDVPYLFANYVAILAAIPAVCGFIGMSIFGFHRFGLFGSLAFAIVRYLLSFVIVYALALIADALAPTFGGQKNQSNALKLAVYSMTPAWLVGVFLLIPGLRILSILGLYSFYLFWLGVPALMKAPDDKSVPYTAAVVVCGIVIYIVIFLVVGAIAFGTAWA